MKPTVVLYHNNCRDGFGGAWAAWKKLKNKASYIGVDYHQPLLAGLLNKTVYLIDFCYPERIMKHLVKNNKKVVVIDHHQSALSSIRLASQYFFDNNHSGAVLSWKYFHPKKKTPLLLRYVEDSDLWKFGLPYSRFLTVALDIYRHDFLTWDKLAKGLERKGFLNKLVFKGKAIQAYLEATVSRVIENADLVSFDKFKVLAVNGNSFIASLAGNLLALKHPPFSIVWHLKRGKIFVSLRSLGDFDVSVIAKKYGGGGHKNAAGFYLPLKLSRSSFFPWVWLKKSNF